MMGKQAKTSENSGKPAEERIAASQDADRENDRIDKIVAAWNREIPDLDGPVFELSMRAVRLDSILQNALNAGVRKFGLTGTDFELLTALHVIGEDGELRHSDLKAHLVLSSGGTTNILNRLERRGLIERVHCTTDARSRYVRLTEKGREVTLRAMRDSTDLINTLFNNVDCSQVRSTVSAMRQIISALDDQAN